MSETLKKKTTPRKTAAKKKTAPAEPTNVPPTHEEVELLAYKLWVDRGRPHGDAAQDWLRAEEQFRPRSRR